MRRAVLLERTELVGVSVSWAVVIVGTALTLITLPVHTSAAVRALGIPATSGLSESDALRLANRARGYVADVTPLELPSTWKGRIAFDERAVSHLDDVRAVLSGSKAAAGAAAAAAAVWVTVCVAMKRWGALRAGMGWGGRITLGLLGLALVLGVADFDWLFVRFHSLFFAPGTWTFYPDDLLIRLFPERFWVYSAAVWAVVSAAGAGLLAGAARFVPAADERQASSRTAANV